MAENDITIQKILDTINALTASNAALINAVGMNTLEVTKLRLQLEKGGVVVPPVDPPPPPATGNDWTIANKEFYLKGVHQSFVAGANIREGSYINFQPISTTKHSHEDDLANSLSGIRDDMNGKIVRVYVAASSDEQGNPRTDPDLAIRNLDRVLTYAVSRGLYVIPVLTDGAGSGLHVGGDDAFRNSAGYTIDFFKTGYKGNYLTFLRKIMGALGNHPAIFAWEVGNELQANPGLTLESDALAMLNFFKDVVGIMRTLTKKFVAHGGQSTWNVFVHHQAKFKDEYNQLFDYMGFHSYPDLDNPSKLLGTHHDQLLAHEIPDSKRLKLPLVWGEVGVDRVNGQPGAADLLKQALEYFWNQGGDIALQWGYMKPMSSAWEIGWGAPSGLHTVSNADNTLPKHDYLQICKVWVDMSLKA